MGIKDYFKSGENLNVSPELKSLDDLGRDVESAELAEVQRKEKNRFIPHVDFSSASNFARYGSAEQYYDDSVKRVYQTYPYDGSLKEKIEWHNSSSYIDEYIFNKEYPRTNGYINLSVGGWGTLQGSIISGYGAPASGDYEYIQVKGGPHPDHNQPDIRKAFPGDYNGAANFFHEQTRRKSNLALSGENGFSVEFWLKKAAFTIAKTEKEVVFDLWNGHNSSSVDYGRLTIELTGAASGSPFLVTVQSGTKGYFQQSIGTTPTTASLTGWDHYAFTFISSSSNVETKFYLNGELDQTLATGSSINEVTGALIANIGALRTAPSAGLGQDFGSIVEGYGKLSASMDEFRYWTSKRTSKDIEKYWFTQIAGGTNLDVALTGTSTSKFNETNPVNLGVYYKFNEGITSTASIDSSVLDYSGRVSNGSWTGYVGTNSRSTGSAMVLSDAASSEFKDPIIYSFHPDVETLHKDLKETGLTHDLQSNSSIYHTIPSWITEEDEDRGAKTTKKLTQILGSYFDTLHLQIESLPNLKNVDYVSSSYKPYPFAPRLLDNLGFISPNILTQATDLENLASRSNVDEFEQKLHDIKNHIYKNIYNNLVYIYKSKGTEKSFRNLIRCFGVDDELIKFNMYANNTTYELKDNYRTTSYRKRFAAFNNPENYGATVYQSASSDSNSTLSYISGSDTSLHSTTAEFWMPWTLEAEVILPTRPVAGTPGHYVTPFISSSLFGVHEARTDSADFTWQRGEGATATITITDYTELNAGDKVNLVATDGTNYDFEQGDQSSVNGTFEATTSNNQTATNLMNVINTTSGPSGTRFTATVDGAVVTVTQATVGRDGNTTVSLTDSGTAGMSKTDFTGGIAGDKNNFQVYAVREETDSHNVKFLLTSSLQGWPTITSSFYDDTYEDQKWNLAVRFYSDKTNNGGIVKGGAVNDFTQGSTDSTTMYVELYGVNCVADQVLNEFHVSGALTNTGTSNTSNKRIYCGAHRTNFTGSLLQESNVKISSIKYWKNYLSNNVIKAHAKDASNFGSEHPYENIGLARTSLTGTYVPAMESLALNWDFNTVTGSGQTGTNSTGDFIVSDYSSGSVATTSRYDWFGNISKNQHVGKGDFFPTNSTSSITNEFIFSAKQRLPESIGSETMVNILSRDDEVFTRDSRPVKHFFAIEKSMYQSISEEMINFFATIVDFNNLIGEPVNRYRQDYKDLGKIRQLFFERVRNTPSLERYINFYKWIDSSISKMILQLIPASANMSERLRNVVESHVLERNKYWTKLPILNFKDSDPESGIRGINELLYDWKHGHGPISNVQSDNCFWWKERARTTHSVITSGDTTIDSQRGVIQDIDKHTSGSAPNLSSYTTSTDTGTTYIGSTYAIRRFSKPYKMSAGEGRSLHGGTNFHSNKKIDYVNIATKEFGELITLVGPGSHRLEVSADYLFISASNINSFKDCDDELDLNQKRKYTFSVENSREHQDSSGYYLGKGDLLLPFNIHSSSVKTGYAKEIADSTIGLSLGSADFTNMHVDVYGDDKETPLQGVFTEKFVGGRQHRHIALNKYDSTLSTKNNLQDETTRPESWFILLGTTGSGEGFGIVDATYTTTGIHDKDTPRAKRIRDEFAKRPVNLRNIQQTTGSGIGNYETNWNVVSTTGRTQNNAFFKENGGVSLPVRLTVNLPATTHVHTLVAAAASGSQGNIFGSPPNALEASSNRFDNDNTLFSLPRRDLTGSNSVVVSRFSAPGGPEVSSRGYLDIMAEEYSVHNALPYRNLTVRSSGSGEDGTISMNIGGRQPLGLAAAATITITDFTELNNGDKVTLVATDSTSYDFTCGSQSSVNGTWEAASSNNQTATNLMNVINTSSGPSGTRFNATVDGAVVTVTQVTVGTAGNTTVSLTDSGTAGMSKTDFTGGRQTTILRDREGLRTRLSRHCGQFGFDSQWGRSDWRSAGADEVASFHKVNRNPIRRIKVK